MLKGRGSFAEFGLNYLKPKFTEQELWGSGCQTVTAGISIADSGLFWMVFGVLLASLLLACPCEAGKKNDSQAGAGSTNWPTLTDFRKDHPLVTDDLCKTEEQITTCDVPVMVYSPWRQSISAPSNLFSIEDAFNDYGDWKRFGAGRCNYFFVSGEFFGTVCLFPHDDFEDVRKALVKAQGEPDTSETINVGKDEPIADTRLFWRHYGVQLDEYGGSISVYDPVIADRRILASRFAIFDGKLVHDHRIDLAKLRIP